jgi:hypothetical protein
MPSVVTSVSAPYPITRVLSPCTGTYSYGSTSVFNYDSYYRLYNNPAHRTKPNPLDETFLAKQLTRRIKPSVTGWYPKAKLTRYCLSGTWKDAIQEGQAKGLGSNFSSTTLPFTVNTDWESKVLQHIRNRFVNLGDSLAEYRATASMFARFGKEMYSVAKRLRDLKKFRTKLSFCSIPLAELAYSFGIAPLAEDLFSYTEALRLRLESPIEVKFLETARAYKRENPTWTDYTNVSVRAQVQERAEGWVRLVPVGSIIHLGNPSTWAWAVTPFSFVVDWGIPIGRWLEDLDTIRIIQGIKGSRTVKENVVRHFTITRPKYGGGLHLGSSGKTGYKSHVRYVIDSIPVPDVPRWKPSISWHKVYRAMTLLIAVRGCKPIVRQPVGLPFPGYRSRPVDTHSP